MSLMQRAIWSKNCTVDRYKKLTPTYVLKPQRISDTHKEGNPIAAVKELYVA